MADHSISDADREEGLNVNILNVKGRTCAFDMKTVNLAIKRDYYATGEVELRAWQEESSRMSASAQHEEKNNKDTSVTLTEMYRGSQYCLRTAVCRTARTVV